MTTTLRPIRRGKVILAVLQVLLDPDTAPVHCYRIAQLADVLPGSAHLALQRLVDNGWAESCWEELDPDQPGQRRRLYQLTPEGTNAARATLDRPGHQDRP